MISPPERDNGKVAIITGASEVVLEVCNLRRKRRVVDEPGQGPGRNFQVIVHPGR